jgi:hypothetical protein
MFTPSRADVRRFFCETWRKHGAGEVLLPIEALALDWIRRHPEYEEELADAGDALGREYPAESGQSNPFLHLAMHLAIAEQLSVDQPPGIRAAFERLLARSRDEHEASHQVMECLGEVLWESQRAGHPPEQMTANYLDCLRRRAT